MISQYVYRCQNGLTTKKPSSQGSNKNFFKCIFDKKVEWYKFGGSLKKEKVPIKNNKLLGTYGDFRNIRPILMSPFYSNYCLERVLLMNVDEIHCTKY